MPHLPTTPSQLVIIIAHRCEVEAEWCTNVKGAISLPLGLLLLAGRSLRKSLLARIAGRPSWLKRLPARQSPDPPPSPPPSPSPPPPSPPPTFPNPSPSSPPLPHHKSIYDLPPCISPSSFTLTFYFQEFRLFYYFAAAKPKLNKIRTLMFS